MAKRKKKKPQKVFSAPELVGRNPDSSSSSLRSGENDVEEEIISTHVWETEKVIHVWESNEDDNSKWENVKELRTDGGVEEEEEEEDNSCNKDVREWQQEEENRRMELDMSERQDFYKEPSTGIPSEAVGTSIEVNEGILYPCCCVDEEDDRSKIFKAIYRIIYLLKCRNSCECICEDNVGSGPVSPKLYEGNEDNLRGNGSSYGENRKEQLYKKVYLLKNNVKNNMYQIDAGTSNPRFDIEEEDESSGEKYIFYEEDYAYNKDVGTSISNPSFYGDEDINGPDEVNRFYEEVGKNYIDFDGDRVDIDASSSTFSKEEDHLSEEKAFPTEEVRKNHLYNNGRRTDVEAVDSSIPKKEEDNLSEEKVFVREVKQNDLYKNGHRSDVGASDSKLPKKKEDDFSEKKAFLREVARKKYLHNYGHRSDVGASETRLPKEKKKDNFSEKLELLREEARKKYLHNIGPRSDVGASDSRLSKEKEEDNFSEKKAFLCEEARKKYLYNNGQRSDVGASDSRLSKEKEEDNFSEEKAFLREEARKNDLYRRNYLKKHGNINQLIKYVGTTIPKVFEEMDKAGTKENSSKEDKKSDLKKEKTYLAQNKNSNERKTNDGIANRIFYKEKWPNKKTNPLKIKDDLHTKKKYVPKTGKGNELKSDVHTTYPRYQVEKTNGSEVKSFFREGRKNNVRKEKEYLSKKGKSNELKNGVGITKPIFQEEDFFSSMEDINLCEERIGTEDKKDDLYKRNIAAESRKPKEMKKVTGSSTTNPVTLRLWAEEARINSLAPFHKNPRGQKRRKIQVPRSQKKSRTRRKKEFTFAIPHEYKESEGWHITAGVNDNDPDWTTDAAPSSEDEDEEARQFVSSVDNVTKTLQDIKHELSLKMEQNRKDEKILEELWKRQEEYEDTGNFKQYSFVCAGRLTVRSAKSIEHLNQQELLVLQTQIHDILEKFWKRTIESRALSQKCIEMTNELQMLLRRVKKMKRAIFLNKM